ncbi:MAG: hypothetical protein AAGF23_04085 [Acidobacteriota bacterium]
MLRPISREELLSKAPEWHAVLTIGEAGRKVQRAVSDLPTEIQRSAEIIVQVMTLFGQFRNSPLFPETLGPTPDPDKP